MIRMPGKDGIESLAVCLLHGHRHPAHEDLVARLAGEAGFNQVSLGSRVAPLPRIVPRGDTTVVDAAYLIALERAKSAETTAPAINLRRRSIGGLVAPNHKFKGWVL